MTAYNKASVLAGGVIKEYREKAGLTQEGLAAQVNLDVRTIRGYELGEHLLTNVQIAKKIATILRIPSVRSGLSEIISAVFDDPGKAFDEIWQLINTANFAQAHHNVLALREHLSLRADDRGNSQHLAYACFLAGHIEAIMCPTHHVDQALAHFRAMEEYAQGDPTLMNISLTYQGDMLRRGGKINEAVAVLERAWATTPEASMSARGNHQQILARAYFHKRNIPQFEAAIDRSIALAEAVATSNTPDAIRVSYSIYTVYEEHARCLAKINKIKRSLAALEKAEKASPDELRWQMNLSATRGEVLIRQAIMENVRGFLSHDTFQEGVSLLKIASEQARQSGHNRLLHRIDGVSYYLSQQSLAFLKAADVLNEAIDRRGMLE